MRGVFKCFRRSAVLAALLTLFMTQGAAARTGNETQARLREQFERVRQYIVVAFGRLTIPPGRS